MCALHSKHSGKTSALFWSKKALTLPPQCLCHLSLSFQGDPVTEIQEKNNNPYNNTYTHACMIALCVNMEEESLSNQ